MHNRRHPKKAWPHRMSRLGLGFEASFGIIWYNICIKKTKKSAQKDKSRAVSFILIIYVYAQQKTPKKAWTKKPRHRMSGLGLGFEASFGIYYCFATKNSTPK